MKLCTAFLSLIICFQWVNIQAQGIWAAQLEKRAYAQNVSAKIEIFRKGFGGMSEKIQFNGLKNG
jgi:hypothetical protein